LKLQVQNPFYIDLRSLALLRICIGLIILFDYIFRLSDVGIFYTDQGVLPREVLINELWVLNFKWSLLLLTGNKFVVIGVFLVGILLSIFLIIGYRIKWVIFFSWIILISIQNRNPLITNAGDTILHLLLFWCFFLPVGNKFSIDKNKNSNFSSINISIPCYALIIQIIIVYFFSALYKDDLVWVNEGSAMYYALNIDQVVTPFGKSLLEYPTLLKVLSIFSYYLELLGPFLILIPLYTKIFRWIAIVLFMSFHFLTMLLFDLGVFSFIGMATWLLFIPKEFWDKSFGNESSSNRTVNSFHYVDIIPGFLIVYVLLWNIRGLDFDRYKKYFPVKANVIAQVFQTQQRWKLFAPIPIRDDGCFVIEGVHANGEHLDLLRENQPVQFEKDTPVSKRFRSKRWKKYLASLYANRKYAPYFLKFLCQEIPSDPKVGPFPKISLIYMKEITPAEGEKAKPLEKVILAKVDCLAK
jgi:hypothetical protein